MRDWTKLEQNIIAPQCSPDKQTDMSQLQQAAEELIAALRSRPTQYSESLVSMIHAARDDRSQLCWVLGQALDVVTNNRHERAWVDDLIQTEHEKSWAILKQAKTWNDILHFGQDVVTNKVVSPFYYGYFLGDVARDDMPMWVGNQMLEINKYVLTVDGQDGGLNQRAYLSFLAPEILFKKLAVSLNRIDGIVCGGMPINYKNIAAVKSLAESFDEDEDVEFIDDVQSMAKLPDNPFGALDCKIHKFYVTYQDDGTPFTNMAFGSDNPSLVWENAPNMIDIFKENDIVMCDCVDTIYNRNILLEEMLKVLRTAKTAAHSTLKA
jgi:hypothetical protein